MYIAFVEKDFFDHLNPSVAERRIVSEILKGRVSEISGILSGASGKIVGCER